jgi:hypothetical protein
MAKRKFDHLAYNEFDGKAKRALKKYLERHNYTLVDDGEHKAKVDAIYLDPEGKTVVFENEVRISKTFDAIIKRFPTIHIPSRKYVSEFDYYMVWKGDFTSFISIDKETFQRHRDTQVGVTCKASEVNPVVTEQFIDIPKGDCKLFTLNDKKIFKADSFK